MKNFPLSGVWTEVTCEVWSNHLSKLPTYATEINGCLVHKIEDGKGYKAVGVVMYYPEYKKYFIGDEYPEVLD